MKHKRLEYKNMKRYYKTIETKHFIIKKISNPTKGEKEADGLKENGDRANSYAWAMAESDNYIYIGSNRNLFYSAVKSALSNETLSDIFIKFLFRGDVPIGTNDFAGEIFRYNKSTEEIELVYKSEYAPEGIPYDNGYRGAISFKPYNEDTKSVYIGSFGTKYSRILKFNDYSTDNKPEVVFSDSTGASSIRAMATHDEKLYFGLLISGTDLRIMESASPSIDTWNIVADLNDFNNIPNVDEGSFAFGGIFDLISYNGYLYATIGSGNAPIEKSGFLIFKGKYVGLDSPNSNNYGWSWEMIVGPNAKYEAGMGVPNHVIGTPFKYRASDGKEYVYIGTLTNVIQSLQYITKFDFSRLYFDFIKPAQLYRFDENDNWELVIGTPNKNDSLKTRIGNYKAGFVPLDSKSNYSSIHYMWRMAEYNGKLFLGTFDSSIFYDYFVPDFTPNSIDNFHEILELLLEFISLFNNIDYDNIKDILKLFADADNYCKNDNNKISLSYVCSHYPKVKPSNYLKNYLSNNIINLPFNLLQNLNSFLPDELNSKIEELISDINYIKSRNCFNENIMLSLDNISKNLLENTVEYTDESLLNMIYENLSLQFGEATVEAIKNTIDKFNNIKSKLEEIISMIKEFLTSNNIADQLYYIKKIRDTIDKSDMGFNLYVSLDGINFCKVNTNGFNDKFNYGLRTFISSDTGLYIGTANPFYGGQLWKLIEKL